jgi:hypothetical protein
LVKDENSVSGEPGVAALRGDDDVIRRAESVRVRLDAFYRGLKQSDGFERELTSRLRDSPMFTRTMVDEKIERFAFNWTTAKRTFFPKK